MGWTTEGDKANPTKGLALADTGPLGAGIVSATILMEGDTALYVTLAYRDALNMTDLATATLYLHPAFGPLKVAELTVLANQRLVVRAKDAIEGNVRVSILT